MRFSKTVVKYRIPILILAVILMVPSVMGMAGTRINYDMLDYLPEDMDTVIGQNELMEEFGKGAFSFIIVEDMADKDVAKLKAQIEQVEHVESVIWYDSLTDLSVPKELLPRIQYRALHHDGGLLRQLHVGGYHNGRHPGDPFRLRKAVLCIRHVGAGYRPEGPV